MNYCQTELFDTSPFTHKLLADVIYCPKFMIYWVSFTGHTRWVVDQEYATKFKDRKTALRTLRKLRGYSDGNYLIIEIKE